MTIRTLKAFGLSLLLHLLILLLFVATMQRLIIPPPPSSPKKITLNLQHFVPPPSPKPRRLTQPVTSPPIPKPVPKRSAKPTAPVKKLRDTKRRMLATQSPKENNVTKTVKKIVKKTSLKRKSKKRIVKQHKKDVQKKRLRKRIAKKRVKRSIVKKRSSLANALLGAGTSLYPAKSRHTSPKSRIERNIRRLYGREFESFTPAQKRFIRKNLNEIQRITQNTLSRNGYPEVAARTGQQGTNIVTFYLHPNGDISGLHLKRRMGYSALDRNTLEVIRLAYMHYPRPKSKTKITFYVNYSLY